MVPGEKDNLQLPVAEEKASFNLVDLHPDLLALIICSRVLSVRDLAAISQTCKVLNEAVSDDIRCWLTLVDRGWAHKTSPRHWIASSHRMAPGAPPSLSHFDGMNTPTPNFCALHRVLTVGDSLNGWWKGLDGPKGSLYKIEWGFDCIHALQLHGHTQSTELFASPLFRLGPGHALTVAHALDDTHLVVRCYAPPRSAPAAAEAAAAAATLATAPSTSSFPSPSARTSRSRVCSEAASGAAAATLGVPGSSPVGSASSGSNFAAEVLRFMSGQVQAPRKAARRSQKRATSQGASQAAGPVVWGSNGPAATEPLLATGIIPPTGYDAGHRELLSPSNSAPHASIMQGSSPQQVPTGAGYGLGSSNNSYLASSASAMGRSSHSNANTANGSSHRGAMNPQTKTTAGLHMNGLNSSNNGSGPTGGNAGAGPLAGALDRGGAMGSHAAFGALAGNRSSALTQELRHLHMSGTAPLSSSSPSTALCGPAIATHHLVRLRPACPSRQHPLPGLWKGVHGPHGLQVLEVSTDFGGASARILAHKATGDANIPAGKNCWWASSSPMPPDQAASEKEVRLQEARQWLTDIPNDGEVQLPQIISCHKGKGQIAGHGYNNPQWVNGRLWQYEGKGSQQSFAFLWMWPGGEEPMACVTYSRVPE